MNCSGVVFCLALFASNVPYISAAPCLANALGGLGNLLGGVGKITGSLGKLTGALSLGGTKRNQGFQGNQRETVVNGNGATTQEDDGEIDLVASELDGVFDLIIETAESVENTAEIIAVSDVTYATLAVISNVNSKVINDSNAFCELSAYLEAAVEKLLANVNGVVSSVACLVSILLDEVDVITVKWIIEAVVAVAGNITNAVSSILEGTVEVASEPSQNDVDVKAEPLNGLSSALTNIVDTLTQATGSVNDGVSGIISSADLQNTLGGISSLVSNLALTDITEVVGGLIDSVSGLLSGLFNGITGTLSGTLNAVGGIAGGVLKSLEGITGGSSGIVSQLTGQVSGITSILSGVTLSLNQVITVVAAVIGNISTVSKSLAGILASLQNIGNIGRNAFQISTCRG